MKTPYLAALLVATAAFALAGTQTFAGEASTSASSGTMMHSGRLMHSGSMLGKMKMHAGSGMITPILKQERLDDKTIDKTLRSTSGSEVKAACGVIKSENSVNRGQIQTNWGNFHVQSQSLKAYLKSPLTEEEKTIVADLWKKHFDERKAIVSGSGSDTEKIAALKVSLDSFLTAVSPYVATDKTEAFAAFKAARIKLLDDNATLRLKNETNRDACKTLRTTTKETVKTQVLQTRSTLSSAAVTAFNAKLDSVSAEQRATVYKNVLDRLTLNMNSAKTNAAKANIKQMIDVVQARIDALGASAE